VLPFSPSQWLIHFLFPPTLVGRPNDSCAPLLRHLCMGLSSQRAQPPPHPPFAQSAFVSLVLAGPPHHRERVCSVFLLGCQRLCFFFSPLFCFLGKFFFPVMALHLVFSCRNLIFHLVFLYAAHFPFFGP